MRAINITNSGMRNAQVGFELRSARPATVMIRRDGINFRNVRMLKATADTGIQRLTASLGDDLTDIICHEDPEVDMERVGMFLEKVKKVFIDNSGKVAFRLSRRNVFYTPDGTEKEVKKYHITESNVNTDIPLRWTGRFIPTEQAVRMFVFTRKYQIKHINGLTYDFLFDMARMLHERRSLMLLGSGGRGIGPVVMARGGTPYRAFLEGRICGDKYILLLHLTNLELKPVVSPFIQQQ